MTTTDAGSQTAVWRQLVDIVAQGSGLMDPLSRLMAHQRIAELREGVPVRERRSAATSFAARVDRFDVVAIFAKDEPAVAAPVIARASLSDAEWLEMLPAIPPTSRAVLRNRRDLSGAVEAALASFGPSDFALSDHSGSGASSQIRNLVARIEAFRSQTPVPPTPDAPATTFAFETMITGEIDWVQGSTREALIGLSIADIAPPREQGVDGQAAGAYRRRAPFADARLLVAGQGPTAGDWLISAMPIFNPRDGRFAGYHGTARRPRRDEHAGRDRAPLSATTMPADSLRQMVHELRTPLNAIQGFAEMIDQQMLGPVAAEYRLRARHIVRESRRLIEVVEDLDAAARIDSDRFDVENGTCDLRMLLERIVVEQHFLAESRNVEIVLDVASGIIVAVAEPLLERMAGRLVASVLGLLDEDEVAHLSASTGITGTTLMVSRPKVLQGRADGELLDPANGPEGEWPDAPILGLGFTLRLIANLAREAGATLSLAGDAFRLSLPPAALSQGRSGEQA